MTTLLTKSARALALCGCLLALTASAHAGQHWAYCTVNNDSEVWVSPVLLSDGAGGIGQVKSEFLRTVTDQYPNLHPKVLQSVACFGEGPEYESYDQAQMQQVRNREMKQYSSVHQVHMGPEPKAGKLKDSK